MAAEPLVTEHIFTDAAGNYGAAPRGRRLTESEDLRRRIEALTVQKWSDPGDRAEIDALVEPMRVRLAYLEAHPDEDGPS